MGSTNLQKKKKTTNSEQIVESAPGVLELIRKFGMIAALIEREFHPFLNIHLRDSVEARPFLLVPARGCNLGHRPDANDCL